MPPPFPLPKGLISGAEEGGGYYFWYGSRWRWLLAELATSSLEGQDIFYVHITWTRFVDWVRIFMNINEHLCDMACLQKFPIRSYQNQPPQPQRLDRIVKSRLEQVLIWYYSISE